MPRIRYKSLQIIQANNTPLKIYRSVIGTMGCCAVAKQEKTGRLKRKFKRIQETPEEEVRLEDSIVRTDRQVTSLDSKSIRQTLKGHFYFFHLTSQEIQVVQSKIFHCVCQTGNYVFKKGDTAFCYLIIESGAVVIQEYGKMLHKGDSFGELALIHNATRSASAKVVEKAGFWCLSRFDFKKCIQDIADRNYRSARPLIKDLKIFQLFTTAQIDSVAHAMKIFKYEPGEHIFKQGDPAQTYAVVKEGCISIEIDKKEINRLRPGDAFGEQALYEESKRTASAVAIDKVTILSIRRQQVQNILGAEVLKVARYNSHRWAIQESEVLKELSDLQIEKIMSQISEFKIGQGELVCQAGKRAQFIYFSNQNSFVDKDQQVVTKKIYGQKFLLADGEYKDSLRVLKPGIISRGAISTVREVLGKPIVQLVRQNREKRQSQRQTQVEESHFAKIQLRDLRMLKKLGEGQFGKVFLVSHEQTLFALKCVEKFQVVQNRMESIVREEKQILSSVSHPFLMGYCRSYKDQHFIYFLLEHIRGVEMFDALREIGLVRVSLARFYVASALLAIEYLHGCHIVYRDLKPENIMLESTGYLRIIDLGTAKRLGSEKGYRTFTMIGTPHYMGPEVLQGKGYSFSCDLWSLGVLLYQMLCGRLPYAEDLQDPFQIYYQVMKKGLKFPSAMSETKARKLIEQLLNKTPENRLGRSYAALKSNPFFQNFDWDALYEKRLQPEYRSRLSTKEEEFARNPFQGKFLSFEEGISKEKAKVKRIPLAKWQSIF